MASSLNTADEHEHRPARSGTPTAWLTLIILTALILGWIFFDRIVCGGLRLGLGVLAWNERTELAIDHLALGKNGAIQAQGVVLSFGAKNHRSLWKSDWIEIQPAALGKWLGFSKQEKKHFIHQLAFGKTKLLIDRRGGTPRVDETGSPLLELPRGHYTIPWKALLPDAVSAGPMDLIVISNTDRVSISGLYFFLPDRWTGRMFYSEATVDVGSVHERMAAASISAHWNGSTLSLGKLGLGKKFTLEELTLTPQKDRLEFGLRGRVGEGAIPGLIRGDGSIAVSNNQRRLAVTLVGENMQMDSLSLLFKGGDPHASGTIRQGRFIFRGDLQHPLEADSSLRLVAEDFRWEGRGWDSLRLAATLTGRSFTLTELVLHQKENEVVAQGQSKLPEDWHEALKAPFTASFHAELNDAGALASLAGPEFAQLSGELDFQGALKGAENKAEGYCNLASAGMKVRNLPIDWLKGSLLFEGGKTQLSNLEAWSGKDHIIVNGRVENSRPHAYEATAQFDFANLTKRLAQIGISTASQIGGGAVEGTWNGDGSMAGHAGTFQAKLNDWISPWTSAGMSGSFEGSYSPGHLYCSKVELQAQNLRLGFQLAASPTRLEANSIIATRKGKSDSLIQGEISLPMNAPALWQSGAFIANLGMKDPLDLQLTLHGIKVEELADLFGQQTPCTGALEGDFTAKGTPESPEIHTAFKIAKLTLPDTKTTIGLAGSIDATAGRATCLLLQDPSKNSPLMIQAEMPFRFLAENGELHFADPQATLHAVATLHSVPLQGWLALLKGSPWILNGGLLDGSLTLGGTLVQPTVEGNLLLNANELGIPNLPLLGNLKLPLLFTMSKATITQGSVFLGTNPVILSGLVDWSTNPWMAHLDLSGKDITFPKLAEIESRGDADLSLSMQGSNIPTLSGKLTIKELHGTLPHDILPSLDPPGIALQNAFTLFPSKEASSTVQLDLHAGTTGFLPLDESGTNADATQLQADLHLHGGVNAPQWTGSIEARNAFLDFPAGRFVIPSATLQADNQGQEQLSFTAYGLTRLGYCTIEKTGSLKTGALSLELMTPSSETTVADLMLALATPIQSGVSPLVQLPAWIRQNMLFVTSSTGRMNQTEGETDGESLGFYGRPWSMMLQQTAPSPSLQEDQGVPKK